jgi:hypothetical protein
MILGFSRWINLDIDSALGSLHCVEVSCVAQVSEENSASILHLHLDPEDGASTLI